MSREEEKMSGEDEKLQLGNRSAPKPPGISHKAYIEPDEEEEEESDERDPLNYRRTPTAKPRSNHICQIGLPLIRCHSKSSRGNYRAQKRGEICAPKLSCKYVSVS